MNKKYRKTDFVLLPEKLPPTQVLIGVLIPMPVLVASYNWFPQDCVTTSEKYEILSLEGLCISNLFSFSTTSGGNVSMWCCFNWYPGQVSTGSQLFSKTLTFSISVRGSASLTWEILGENVREGVKEFHCFYLRRLALAKIKLKFKCCSCNKLFLHQRNLDSYKKYVERGKKRIVSISGSPTYK